MSRTKPSKSKMAKFRESVRNTFLRYALFPILALTMLWGIGVLLYGFFAVQQTNVKVNGRIMDALQAQYGAYYEMLQSASGNAVLQKSLEPDADSGDVTSVNELLYGFNNRQTIHSIFYLFDAGGRLVASNTWEIRGGYDISRRFSEYVREQIAGKPAGSVYQLTSRRQTPGGRDSVYTMATPVMREGLVAGYLVFDLVESDFIQFTSSREVNYTVITDAFENTISTSNTSILGPVAKFSPQPDANGRITVEDIPMYLTSGSRSGCPFRVYTMTSLVFQTQFIVFGLAFIAVSALLLVILMIRLSGRVAEKNTNRLNELMRALEETHQGNYDRRLVPSDVRADEFNYLSEQYQSLLERIGHLLEINRALSDMQRLTEIKQLEAQFNPHFIFNVLETIKYEMYVDTDKASEIINLLAQLLRYSISSGSDTVPLRHDLEHIKTYLALQKTRYGERLSYSICIPDVIEGFRLPKLVIQPLVENCITHGYRNKETLSVTITGTLEGDKAEIRVTDNGDGIDEKRLSELRELLKNDEASAENIGLYNSHRRIQLMYGASYGLEISSITAIGTEVVLRFPAEIQQAAERGPGDV